jgi:hypothetical protein
MALSAITLYSAATSDGANPFTTGGYTFPSGARVGVIVTLVNDGGSERPADTITLTESNGLVLTRRAVIQDASNQDFANAIAIYQATGTGVAGTLTVSKTGTSPGRWHIQPFSYTGHDPSSNFIPLLQAQATVSDGVYQPTLSASPEATSDVLAVLHGVLNGGSPNIVHGTGWTELYDVASTDWYNTQGQVRTGSTNNTARWDDVSVGGDGYYRRPLACVIEIKAAGGGTVINAGVDALAITELAASVKLSRAIAASFDALSITERTAPVKLSKAISAGFDALAITERTAVAKLSRNIAAGLDVVVLTERQATLSTGTGIAAGFDALLISEPPALVNRGRRVAAGFDALAIAERVATTRLAKAIAAGMDQLAITERSAAVSSGLQLSAGLDALVLTERQALINRKTAITAGFDQLTVQERLAAVKLSRLVSAGMDALLVQERAAVVSLAKAIVAGFSQLSIAERQAIVEGEFAITQVVAERVIQVLRRDPVVRVAPRDTVVTVAPRGRIIH